MKGLTLLLALLFALGAAGCGGGEDESAAPETVEGTVATTTEDSGGEEAEGDPEAGKAVFAEGGCGGCHTFGPAGSTGSAGPNLDEADVSYEDAVSQIENGGGGMPPFGDRFSDKQIADVAAFVTQG